MKNILTKALLASILGVSLLMFAGISAADAWVDPNYHHGHHHPHKYKRCYWVWKHHHKVKQCRWEYR